MSSLDPEQLAAQLDAIALDLGGGERAGECARILRRAVADVRGGQTIEGAERASELALAFQDGSMIADAFDGLIGRREMPTARERLRRALVGPTVAVSAVGNDAPRNELWELFLAACVRTQGFEPQFGDQICAPEEPKPDLFVAVDGITLALEAKRIRGDRYLADRVARAVLQIASACDRGRAGAGLIAMDASFAVGQHAQNPPRTVASRQAIGEVRDALRPDLQQLAAEVGLLIGAETGRRHVVGITIMVLPVVFYRDTRSLGLIRSFTSGPIVNDRSAEGLRAYETLRRRAFSDP